MEANMLVRIVKERVISMDKHHWERLVHSTVGIRSFLQVEESKEMQKILKTASGQASCRQSKSYVLI